MPSQLALDLSKSRVRAVEIDGSAKSPRVRAFAAADVAAPPPPAEGEAPPPSWGEALRELCSKRKLVREPSAVALASVDCTFRELELPFTTPDQIDKVIKFEAESHLQLVDIDSVVVSYQTLDSDGRGGSRLLVAACAKDAIRGVLRDCGAIAADPHFADLHLTALYTSLRATGCLAPAPEPPPDAPPGQGPRGEVVLVLECDPDLTHLLVARGDELLAARAIRFGTALRAAEGGEGARVAEVAAAAATSVEAGRHEAHGRHEHDETLVVVDDLAGEGVARHARRGGGDYFTRLKREVQRTLFRLGPAAEPVARVFLLGTTAREEGFAERLSSALALPVEAARPFDALEHDLDEEALEQANAEGAAALGAALRLLGVEGGSRVDFRQEEVRYARRFDQVKVALSTFAIVALVCVALLCIDRAKQWQVKKWERLVAARAAVDEFTQHAETTALQQAVSAGKVGPLEGVRQAKSDLRKRKADFESELGRSGTIPRLVSGLDYLNAVFSAVDANLAKIGRIEIHSIDLDAGRDDGQKPLLKLRLLLTGPTEVDALCAALRASPAVREVANPTVQPYKDGRLEVSNLEIELKPDYDPRRARASGESP